MKCTQVRENLDAFADGEISFAERENIASHLASCESCSSEFEGLKSLSKAMKNTLPLVAPSVLDARIIGAFETHNAEKTAVVTEEQQEKIGWFGIPKLAFATAFLLLALFSAFAFQLGRMSVETAENSTTVMAENNPKDDDKNKQNALVEKTSDDKNETQNVVTQIVKVPVIKEKIVKVPVIKEKIVTKTVYVNRNRRGKAKSTNDDFALNSSVKNGEVLTQTNLKGFEPVAKIKPKITKKEE